VPRHSGLHFVAGFQVESNHLTSVFISMAMFHVSLVLFLMLVSQLAFVLDTAIRGSATETQREISTRPLVAAVSQSSKRRENLFGIIPSRAAVMKSVRAVGEHPPRMAFIESFTQPDTTDDLYCDDDDENINDDEDEENDSGDDCSGKKKPAAVSSVPVEQRRRPSLVIAGDAKALESVRTVHSPKSQRPITTSPRASATSAVGVSPPPCQDAALKLAASPTVPSPVKPPQSATTDVSSTNDRRGWRAAWTSKLTGSLNLLDLLASFALFAYVAASHSTPLRHHAYLCLACIGQLLVSRLLGRAR
jgi:hypothetical protein